MNLSAKTEYACIALLHLSASYGTEKIVSLRAISETHGIPSRFLVQILVPLKGAGLLQSIRGSSGGYRLAIDPKKLTLGKVMSVMGELPDKLTSNVGSDSPLSRVLMQAWNNTYCRQLEMLNSITLAELLQQAGGQEEMYYI